MRYLLGFFNLILFAFSLSVIASPTGKVVQGFPADAGQDQLICSDQTELQGSDQGVSTALWTIIEGSGIVDSPNSSSTLVSNLSPGLNKIIYEFYDGALLLASDTVEIIRFLPPIVSAGPDFSACAGEPTSMSGSTLLAFESGIWQSIGHAENLSDPSLSNSLLSISIPGSYAFEWTVTNLICPISSDTVIVEIIAPPTSPEAGVEQTICTTFTTLLANEPVLGETGTWTVIEGSGIFSDQNSASSSVSGLSAGNNILRWTISNANCTPVSDDVLIIVETAPTAEAGSDQTICSSSATLNSTAVPGGVWSIVAGSGSFEDASNATSEVSGLSIGINVFRWTVSGGSCGEVFDEVIITIDENPTTALAGDDQNICSTSATLAANTPTVGAGTWSLVSGSGNITNTSASNTNVSGLSPGINIFQWTISNGICSSTSDQITISVDDAPVTPEAGSDQNICSSSAILDATAATSGAWSVIFGTGLFTAETNATTSVTGLSNGNNVFRWTVPGGSCGEVFDEVTITFDENPTTALAGDDQNICSTSATLAANTPTVGAGTWSLVSGSGNITNTSAFNSNISGLSPGINIFQWTISNGICPPSSDQVTITIDAAPSIPEAGQDQTICTFNTILSAFASTGASWSVVSGTGTFANTSLANTNVTGLSVGPNVFRWTIPGGACGSVSDDVTITVQAQPTLALAGVDQIICATVSNLNGNVPAVGNGVWTVISGTGTFANAALSNTSVSGLSTGTNVLRWTISNGVCTQSFDQVSIEVDANPITPNAGSDQNICNNSTTLAATAATGGTWSIISGTGTFANTSLANTNVTGLSVGNNVFRWTIPGGACGSVSDDMTITVQAQPSTALAGSDQIICATVTSLDGNVPAVGNGGWTVISGAGTFANANLGNSSVFGLSTGNNVLRWTISNGVCTPTFDEVSIEVDANPITPNAGSDQNICNNSTTLAATAATGGSWSVVSGTGTFTNASLANTNVVGLSVGPNVFRWTIPGGACGSVSDNVSITIQAQPTLALAGVDQIICATVSNLNGNVPAVGNGVWTVVLGSGTFANANLANTSVSGLSTGNNVLRWTISNGVCTPSFDEVSIEVDQNTIAPNAGSDQNICTPITNLNATAAAGGVWAVVSGSGIFANANIASTSVSGLSLGANIFRWTIDGGTCPDLSDEVTITLNTAPSSALAGQDQIICASSTTLNGNAPPIGSGIWTVVSGTAIFGNANQPITNVSGLSVGQNILRWSISNGVCTPSIDELVVTVQSSPTVATAGSDQSVCGNETQLSANTPTISLGGWTVVSGSGTFTNAANPQTQVTGLGNGINVFRWTITNGFCQPSIDEVSIQRFQNPTAANAGLNATICNTDQNLSANVPTVGTGIWTVISGVANILTPNDPNTTISGFSLGQVVLRWTISNGTCPASTDDLVLQVLAAPTSNAGINQSVCSTSATLNASAAGAGNTGVWTLMSGTGIIQNVNNPNTSISNLGLGANVFKWSVTNTACPEALSQVTITRTESPSPALAGNDQQTCATSAILAAVPPTIGSGFWTVSVGSGIIDNPSSASSTVIGLSAGLNTLVWTVSSGTCLSTSDVVTILVDQNPTSANAGSDQQICSTVSNFEATAPTVGTGVWTLISGTGTIAQINNASSQISNLAVGANVFRWTVTNGSCVTFDEVTITRFLSPTVASAGVDQTICASTVQLTGNNPSIGIGSWTIITGSGTIANNASASTAVSNLAPGANVFRWTISNGACLASSDEITIIRQIPPSPALAGIDAEVCGSSLNLSATTPISGNGIWSLISGSGTIASPQNANTAVNDLGIGANVFQWTTLSGNCPALTDQVTIIRFDNPSNADAGNDIAVCGNTVVLSAQVPLVGVGQWSIIAGTGTLVNPTANNSGIEGVSEGLLFLNWTVSNGVCPASSDQIIVNAQSLTFIADAGPDQEVCGNVAEINGSEPGTASALWTFLNGGGTFDLPQFPSVLAFTSFNGPQLIEYAISNGACVSRDTMVLTSWQVLSPISAGSDTSLCEDVYFLIGSVDDYANLNWSATTAIIESPTNDSTAVSSLLPGQNIFTFTASNGTCPIQTDQVIVSYLAPTTPATVMEDAFLCSDSIQISATPDGGEWSVLGPFGTIANPTESNTNLTNVTLGSTEVVYTIALGNCISSDTLRIVRSESPTLADAGPDQQICGQEAFLAGNAPDVGVGTWIFIDILAEISNVSDPNASLFAEESGLRAMAWSITNNFCTVSDTVEMIFLETPVANGGPNIITCLNDTAFLQAEIPDFGISYWNLITNNATLEDSLFQNTSLTPVETGNAYIWWTVSNGACRDSDLVVITILSPDDPECLANEPAVFIPEGFSPNGDGKFDQFVITKPSVKALRLQVFDRWGNLVYENQDYQNDWEGTSNKANVLSGNQLSEGTYYYVVSIEDESESRSGYFTLWR